MTATKRWQRLGFNAAPVLAALALVSPSASAQVPTVQGCTEAMYVDRTAPGANRDLIWEFSTSTDPERCMKIQAGQSFTFLGNFSDHPLIGSGGDTPNPIHTHANGLVTFQSPGVFGFVCVIHPPMRGAILVVPADGVPAAPVPVGNRWLWLLVAPVLTAAGWFAVRQRGSEASLLGSHPRALGDLGVFCGSNPPDCRRARLRA